VGGVGGRGNGTWLLCGSRAKWACDNDARGKRKCTQSTGHAVRESSGGAFRRDVSGASPFT